ncbi:MAG: anti-sigma factor [Chloroflexi bacterium]|nr:anti-sigma factor [Chloroflexota bacterium]
MNSDRFSPGEQEPSESNNLGQSDATLSVSDAVEALVPAYSVGAVDAEERLLMQAQLANYPKAAADLSDYTALADALLYSAPPVQAPAHLANRLQMALRQPERAPEPIRWWSRLRDLVWQGPYNHLAATTVILLLLVLNVYAITQNRQLQATETQLTTKQDELNRALLVLLETEKMNELALPPAQENSEAHADVLWNAEAGVAVLYARSFPTIPPDKAYQLWLLRDGKRASGGLFTVDPNGAGLLIFPVTQPLDTLQAMGITTEPAQGSPGPTSKAVVRKQFQ